MVIPEVFKRLLFPSRPASPIIALLTDFGLTDHYVGAMKAVIASVHPEARVIDISHDIAPQHTREGAYVLWSSYGFFPRGTIFVSVVDPGVGSKRKIIALRTNKYVFLAPDNGLLDLVRVDEPSSESYEVRVKDSPYVLSHISSTFHGRDVFAPVAAYLSRGVGLNEVGFLTSLAPCEDVFFDPGVQRGRALILHVDHFGNIVTNIRVDRGSVAVRHVSIGARRIDQWITNYQEAPAKTPCLLVGSSGLIEITMKNGNAGAHLKVRSGSRVKVQLV